MSQLHVNHIKPQVEKDFKDIIDLSDVESAKGKHLEIFLELDNEFNEQAGIYELDKTAKQLKERLDEVIDKIANDEEIEITFNIS